MWTEKWWDEGRPPQATHTTITPDSNVAVNGVRNTNGSALSPTPSSRLTMSNGVEPDSLVNSDHQRTLSNGHGDWELIISPTSQIDNSMKFISPSSPDPGVGQSLSTSSSSTSLKPAAKLTKKPRASLTNVKSLTGKRLTTSKSSSAIDIDRRQSREGSHQLSPINGKAQDASNSAVAGADNGLDRLTVMTDGKKDHTRHSSISNTDWQLSSKSSKNCDSNFISKPSAKTAGENGTFSDRLLDISTEIGLESPSSNSSSSRGSDETSNLSPSPARVFPDLSLDLSGTQRVTSGPTSDHSCSWSDSSETASWDSSLKTPPLYDVCDIASSLSAERQTHRLQSMQSQLSNPSSSASPVKPARQDRPAAAADNASLGKSKLASTARSSWSEEPAVLALDTESSYFHAPTASTVPIQGLNKPTRELNTPVERKVPKSFSGRGPVPLANGHAGKQKAYSLVSDGAEESRSVVLYEYERPKKSPQGPALVESYFPYLAGDPLHESNSCSEQWSEKGEGRTSRHLNRPYDNDYYDEDDDRANAITIVVLLVMGVAFVVGVVFLIYSSSSVKTEYDTGDKDSVDLMNAVYQRRIADIIMDASRQHQKDVQAFQGGSGFARQGAPPQGPGPAQTQAAHAAGSPAQGKHLCPLVPPELVGNMTDVNLTQPLDIDDIMAEHADVLEGGEWAPSDCVSRHRVAFVIPYRDRWGHLKSLLYYLIPVLKRQQIHFRMFVVEQFGNDTFNKGRIMNAAFREALKLFDFQCVTFHDVDLVPEDDRNMYSCAEMPKHMSIGIDKFNYLLPYDGLVGGVLMFRTEHFQQVNGYSNMYWGWGAEDDDMTTRILHQGLRIYRPPSNIARYKMVKHDGRKTSEVSVRMKLLRSAARRSKMEGLNNIQYNLLYTHTEKLFTHFLVDIGHP
ncbi:hypothetical protein EGW08_001485 [Elysia chlorotica]|uniref:Galactosyltransferase C-terminal domain-containing protein n=1 Tax=Elysia chlorotica TaxID=188477 RepID=A0A3S1BWV5_ELYCH|nr:hypothetical protein EGW08_001485 [Elysia chlorotica]